MEIKTTTFLLRKLKIEDAEDIYRNICDYDIVQWLEHVPWPYMIDDAKKWINLTLEEYEKKDPDIFNMAIEKNNEVIGSIGIHDLKKSNKTEIGYWLSKKYHGQGIMTEVLKVFLDNIIKKFNLKKIKIGFFEGNIASQKVIEKNGFKKEKFVINAAKPRGKFVNAYLYSKTIK